MLRVTIAWIIVIGFCANVGMLDAQEVPYTSEVASDNFDRPNGPLGTNWAEPIASQGNLVITNDMVGVDTQNAHCEAFWTSNSFSNDQYSQATLTSIGPWTGVILRADTNQDVFYLGFVFGPNDYRIYFRYEGTYYSLATGSNVTWQVGDVLSEEVSGSTNPMTVTMYQNGTPVLMWRSTTGDVVKNNGSPGMGIYSPSGDNLTLGDWEGGNLDPDTNAPTVPANLTANAVSPVQINLNWTASTDDVGVAGYLVERSQGAGSTNYILIATPTGTNYSDTGLTANTTYNYKLMATDAAGNLSECTEVVTATTPIPNPPTISVISNQTTLVGISVGPFPFTISDPPIDPSTLTVTATSSNTNLVPDQNLVIANLGSTQALVATPAAGQTGTSTITVTVSNGVNSTNESFLLTVNPPSGATGIFANPTNIVIPSLGAATPYPSTIEVSGEVGPITNLEVTLNSMSDVNPSAVNALLVGPDGQAVVLMSDTVGDNPMTNITFTLSDQAFYPLPNNSPMADGTFQATDYAPNNTNAPYSFGSPAPAPPYSASLGGAFDGLSPNGTWSLYVYDGGPDEGGEISGGWSLAITTLLPPTISGLTNQTTVVNTPSAAIPFEIGDAQTPASNLVLTAISSDAAVVAVSGIVFTNSDDTFTNQTITLTPQPNVIGATTISVIVTDGDGLSATNSFLMTVNQGQLTVGGITASNKTYDGTVSAALNVSTASLEGEGLSGSDVTLNTSGVGGTFVDGNVGTNKTVQIAGLVLNGADAGNYILTQPTTTANITPAPLTVSADNTNKVYGQALDIAVDGFGVVGLVSTDSVSGVSLSSAGAAAGADTGVYAIGISNAVGDAGLTNYLITYVAGTLSVGEAVLGVTATNVSREYGRTNPVLSVSYNGFENGDTAGDLGGTLVLSTAAGTNSAVGDYAIVPSGLTSTNYTISYTNGVLSVTNGLLTVSADNTNKVYGQALDIAVDGFGVVGLVSTDSVSGVSLSSAGAAAGADTGVYAIGISNAVGDAGLTNYLITYVAGTLSVGEAVLGVTATNVSREYGRTNPVLSVSYNGFENGDTAGDLGGTLVLSTAAGTNSAVGDYAIVPSGLTSTNYTISYTNGVLSVTNGLLTVSADNTNKVYGQALDIAVDGFGVVGLVSTDSVSGVSLSSAGAAAGADTGVYAIGISNAVGDAGLTNYLITYVAGTLSVGEAVLGVTATNVSREYGRTNPVLSVSYNGFENGDTAGDLGGTLVLSTAAGTNSAVGDYAIVPSGLTSTNYTISYTNGVLSVTNGLLTVSADNTNKVYGQALDIAVDGFGVVGLVSTDSVSGVSLSSAGAAAGADTGVYAIGISNAVGDAGLTNYLITYVAGTLSVGEAVLGVTATNVSREYGRTNPVLSVSYNGFENGDTAGDLGGTLVLSTAAGTNSAVGDYAIVPSGLTSTNYTISYTNGVLSVTNGLLTVSADNTNKVYGQALDIAVDGFGVVGLVSTDSVSGVSLSSAGAAAGADTGVYAIGISNAVGDAGLTNYLITYVAGTLSVGEAVLGVTATNVSREYGRTNPVLSVSYNGFENGDTAGDLGGTLVLSTAAGTNSAVGDYAIVPSGLTSTNYTISYTNGVLSVTNGLLTVSADNTNKVYGQALDIAVDGFGVVGLVSTDSVSGVSLSSAGAAAGADTGVYAIGISNAVGDAGLTNYLITYVAGTLSVGEAVLGVTATNVSREYGRTNPVLSVSYNGFENGDTAGDLGGTLVLSTAAGTNSAVGDYAIVPSGLTSTNYTISYTNGVLSVTNGLLTVSADNTNKVYGQALDIAVDGFGVVGLVSTDSVSGVSLSSAGAAAGADTGVYAIGISNAVGDAGLTNYLITYVAGTLSVGEAVLGVTATNVSREYGRTNPVLSVSYNGFENGDTAGDLGGTLVLSTAAGTNSAVGDYAIVPSGLTSTNYTISYTNGVLSVTNGLLTVSADNTNKVYGQALDIAVDGFGVVGLVSTDSVSGVSLSSAGAAAGADTGVYAIGISNAVGDAGLTNYLITYVAGTLSVGEAVLGVTATNVSREYGRTNPVLSVSYNGFENGDTAGDLGGTLVLSTAAGTNSAVGDYAIVPSGLTSTNYTISYTNGVLSVTNGLLTVSADNTNKVYGQALDIAVDGFGVVGLVSTDSVSGVSLSSAGAAAGADTGVYAIGISNAVGDAGLTNYLITYVAGTLSVGEAVLGVTATNVSREYGRTNPVLSVSYNGFENGDTAGDLGGTLVLSTAAGTNSAVGDYAIVPSGLTSTNYTISYTNGVLSVTNGLLTVSADNTNKVYGQALDIAVDGFGVVGLVSTDSVSGVSLSSAGAAAGADTGVYAIGISNAVGDAGLTNYLITYVAGTLSVGEAVLGVTATNVSREYGRTNPVLSVSYNGFENGDTAGDLGGTLVLSTAAGTNSAVGDYAIVPSGLTSTNYTISYTNGVLSVTNGLLTVSADNTNKVYGQALDIAVDGFGVVGLVSTDSVSGVSLSSAGAAAGADTGVYAIGISNAVGDAGLTNYLITYVAGTLSVGEAVLGVTATNVSREYGRTNPVLSVSYNGFENGDTAGDLGGTLVLSTAAGTNSAVGDYAIVPSGLTSTNYTISYTNGVLSVTNGLLTVSADNTNKVYGQALDIAVDGFGVVGLVSTDSVSGVSLSSAGAAAGADTGVYAIGISNAVGDAGLTNYLITYVAGTLSVGEAVLGVTATNVSREYGRTNPVLSVSYNGFENGDTAGDLGGTLVLSTAAGTNSAVGDYAIVPSGLTSTNYTISYTNGVLSVTNGLLTVSADNTNKVYGQALDIAVDGFGVVGLVSTDSVSGVSLSSAGAAAGADTGVYAIGISNAVGDAGLTNYLITYVAGTLSVGEAVLGVTATNVSREYGRTNPVLSVSYNGFENGDTAGDLGGTLVLSTAAGTNSAVGDYAIVPSGLTSTNYTISYTNGVLSVTNGLLTVSADNTNKVYGQALDIAVDGFGVVGLVSTDSVSGVSLSSAGAAAGADTGVYAIGISNAVGDAGLTNYLITYVAGTLSVGEAVLGVTATNVSREYGRTNPVLSVSYNGFENGDTAGDLGGTLVLSTAAGTNSAVGDYAIVPSGLTSTNYTISYTNGVLSVTNGLLTVSADNTNKVYGQALDIAVDGFGVVGLVSTDSVSGVSLSSAGAAAGADTGVYAIGISNAVGDAGLTNYLITYVAGTLSVGEAVLGVTATNVSREYGRTNPVLSVSYNGFENGDTAGDLGGTLVLSTAAGTNSAVGDYAIVPSGLTSTNYTISYTNGVLSVTNGLLTVSADNTNKVYGQALDIAVDGFGVVGLVSTDSVSGVSLSSAGAAAGADTGVYAIGISNAVGDAGLTNYLITYVAGTLSVGEAVLGVTATNVSREYGRTNPVLSVSYNGFENGDTAGDLGGTLVLSTAAGTNSAVGDYAIVPSGLTSTNYTISYTNGVLSVTNGLLTVSADNTNKVYGQALDIAVDGFGVVGLVSTDSVSGVSLSSAGAAAGADTGVYAIGISNAVGDAGLTNYLITYVAGTLSVGEAVLGVTATNVSREYGRTNPVLSVSYNGFENGDTAGDLGGTLVLSTAAGTNSAVGDYAIVPSGLTSTNYTISYTNGVLSVTNGLLTVSADNTNKVYGQALDIAVDGFGVVGLVSTDSVSGVSLSSAGAAAGADTGVYAIGISNAVGDAGLTNYLITYVAGTLSVAYAGNFRDTVPPTITITAPTLNQKWSNSEFTVTGTAKDNVAISNVWYSLNGGGWTAATLSNGGSNWTAGVTLTPGTNSIAAYALGTGDNLSTTDTVKFVYILSATLTVLTNGDGMVTPNDNGALLQIGASYSLKAQAAKGFGFVNWTDGEGNVLTNGATLTFIMASNLTFVANFKDITPPTITITAPTLNQKWSNSEFTVTGTAKDNVAISNVWYSLNGGGWTAATLSNGGSNWTAGVTLTPGTNSIAAYALGTGDNLSTTDTVKFVYILSATLTVLTNGDGMVTPNDNGALLQIGASYSLKAQAAKGFGFVNWTDGEGNVLTNGATLTFIMASNLTFVANFKDITPPTITITAPTLNQKWSNSEFTVTGTAKDNVAISNVWYSLNGGGWTAATLSNGGSNWTAGVTLTPGTNSIAAYALGTGDNLSTTDTVKFVYILSATLTVLTNGDGMVTPNDNGALLQIGASYSLKAQAAKGFGFVNWTDGEGNVLTNGATLTFIMASNLTFVANFKDITPPTITITAPTLNQKWSNSEFTVTGTAKDNVAISNVWYSLNGGGWTAATLSNGGSNWTAGVTLTPGTNSIAAYALGTGDNLSTTDTVKIIYLKQDPAPGLFSGLLMSVTPEGQSPLTIAFDAKTFSQSSADTNNDTGVGNYTYAKLSTNTAQLVITYIAPPTITNDGATLFLTFTTNGSGVFTNADTTTGTFTVMPAPSLAPAAIKKAIFVNEIGDEYLLTFSGGKYTALNVSEGGTLSNTYTYTVYSPVGVLIENKETDGGNTVIGHGYNAITFNATNYGTSLTVGYDNTTTNPPDIHYQTFVLPSSEPVAPDSLAGMTGQLTADGNGVALGFGSGTFSQVAADTNNDTGVGNYSYSTQDATNAQLSLSYTAPPTVTNDAAAIFLTFVAPDFALFTNQNDLGSNTIATISFAAATNLVPASLAGMTVNCTNSAGVVDAVSFNGDGTTFSQVETGSVDPGDSSGTYTFTPVSPAGAMVQLDFTGGVLTGSTNYVQTTFTDENSGTFVSTFYDGSGNPPSTNSGTFTVQ